MRRTRAIAFQVVFGDVGPGGAPLADHRHRDVDCRAPFELAANLAGDPQSAERKVGGDVLRRLQADHVLLHLDGQIAVFTLEAALS